MLNKHKHSVYFVRRVYLVEKTDENYNVCAELISDDWYTDARTSAVPIEHDENYYILIRCSGKTTCLWVFNIYITMSRFKIVMTAHSSNTDYNRLG